MITLITRSCSSSKHRAQEKLAFNYNNLLRYIYTIYYKYACTCKSTGQYSLNEIYADLVFESLFGH